MDDRTDTQFTAIPYGHQIWLVPLLVSLLLIAISRYNFLLFHTLAELFTVMVGVLMFVVVIQLYRFSKESFLMYLACGYFWISALDLIHTLIYKGMSIYAVETANHATQFWIATRYFEALLLLSSFLFINRRIFAMSIFAAFGAIAVLIYILVMSGQFPDAFIEGQGLTPFKIYSEYLIILILMGALTHLIIKRRLLHPDTYPLLAIAIVFTMIAELAFTFYVSVYGLSNLVGHIFKFFSFWLILSSIIRSSLLKPYLEQEQQISARTKDLSLAKEAAESANKAKSIFLANMSHTLRTPLNAILGFSEMMLRNHAANSSKQEQLAIINSSGKNLLGMINDILDLAKIDVGRMKLEVEAFDLSQMLQEIGDVFKVRAENAHLRFELKLDQKLLRYINADSDKVRHILINLLNNALKFTHEGGFSLCARTMPMMQDPSMFTLILEVKVEDSGPGIATAQQVETFEDFTRSLPEGDESMNAGLGLAVCKSYAELMGGEIGIDTKPGEGSTFRINLPVSRAASVNIADTNAAGPEVVGLEPNQDEWRILVVDDNPANRLLLNSLLSEMGFEIREAENGVEAISVFKEWQPHFIWMDLRMPVMDGYDTTKNIRAMSNGDSVKIVALTASAFREQQEKIIEAGCDAVLHKPYQIHEIFDMMSKYLGVRYNYAETVDEVCVASSDVEVVSHEAITALPKELQKNLKIAAQSLSNEQFDSVLDQVREISPELAEGLRRLAQDFRFDQIIQLIESQKDENL